MLVTLAINVSDVISLKLKSNSRFDLPFKFTLPRFVDVILPSITFIAPALTFNTAAFDISAFGPNVRLALFRLIVFPLITEFKGVSTLVDDVGSSPRLITPLEAPEISLLIIPPV